MRKCINCGNILNDSNSVDDDFDMCDDCACEDLFESTTTKKFPPENHSGVN